MTDNHHGADAMLADWPSPHGGSLADRLRRRFRSGPRPSPAQPQSGAPAMRPTQLALPLDEPRGRERDPGAMPSLFREARRIEAVLSYEQPDLAQIVPDADPASDMKRDRLVLPGGSGLVLHDDPDGAMTYAWMQWGERPGDALPVTDIDPGATLSLESLDKANRAVRKLAQRRCIVPMVRYSVPVLEGDIWSHRWIASATGQIVCVAGVWTVDRIRGPRFTILTGRADDMVRPMILPESELLPWLRAPLKQLLGRLGGRGAAMALDA